MLKEAIYEKCQFELRERESIVEYVCSTHGCKRWLCDLLNPIREAIIELDKHQMPHKFPKNGALSSGKANPKTKDKAKPKKGKKK